MKKENVLRLAIIVPMYNEEAGAEACVRAILCVIASLPIQAKLFVVNDGSKDRTQAVLDKLRAEASFEVVNKVNGGYGTALLSGARIAAEHSYSHLLFIDSDLTNPPEDIARFVPMMEAGYGLIKGSRFSLGGNMRDVPWRRRVFSIFGNLVARLLFRVGVADCTNGFRAVRTDVFLAMPLSESGFALILEELYWAKRMGVRIGEVPTSLKTRANDLRKSAFLYNRQVLWNYLKYALRASLLPYNVNLRHRR